MTCLISNWISTLPGVLSCLISPTGGLIYLMAVARTIASALIQISSREIGVTRLHASVGSGYDNVAQIRTSAAIIERFFLIKGRYTPNDQDQPARERPHNQPREVC